MGTHYNSPIADIESRSSVEVNPVDFAHTNALVESKRLAYGNITKGKILSCRMPDLMIKYNRIITSYGWEQLNATKGASS